LTGWFSLAIWLRHCRGQPSQSKALLMPLRTVNAALANLPRFLVPVRSKFSCREWHRRQQQNISRLLRAEAVLCYKWYFS